MSSLFVLPSWPVIGALLVLVIVLGWAVRHGCAWWNARLEAELDAACGAIREIVDPSGSHAAARAFHSALPAAIEAMASPEDRVRAAI